MHSTTNSPSALDRVGARNKPQGPCAALDPPVSDQITTARASHSKIFLHIVGALPKSKAGSAEERQRR
jgi:hypothetical protein